MARSGQRRSTSTPVPRRQELADPPVVSLPFLIHVGSLNEADRAANHGDSYEGHSLSVSRDPEEWERIARLGGNPWWALRNRDAKFLNAHALTDAQREQVVDWAVENGYAERVEVYEVAWWDDELEQESCTWFESIAEARDEAEALEIPEDEITTRKSHKETQAFLERISASRGILGDLDRLLMLYVDEMLPELDGVWFEDDYGWLSAPRGGILPSRLDRWQRRKIQDPQPR